MLSRKTFYIAVPLGIAYTNLYTKHKPQKAVSITRHILEHSLEQLHLWAIIQVKNRDPDSTHMYTLEINHTSQQKKNQIRLIRFRRLSQTGRVHYSKAHQCIYVFIFKLSICRYSFKRTRKKWGLLVGSSSPSMKLPQVQLCKHLFQQLCHLKQFMVFDQLCHALINLHMVNVQLHERVSSWAMVIPCAINTGKGAA